MFAVRIYRRVIAVIAQTRRLNSLNSGRPALGQYQPRAHPAPLAARILPAHDTRGLRLGGSGLLPGPRSARRGRAVPPLRALRIDVPLLHCAPPR